MDELAGKVAVVTGGGSGIGRGLCQALVEQGMHVVVADIETAAAEQTAELLRADGGHALVANVDVTKPASLEALANLVYGEFGAAHLLCNNAGVSAQGPSVESPPEDWRWVLAVNVEGVMNGIRAFVPRMRAQGAPAHIVNTASIAGADPLDSPGGAAAYSASKAAVIALSEVIWRELQPDGIGLSILFPGRTPSRIAYSQRNRPSEFGGPSAEPVPANAEAELRERFGELKTTEPIEVGRKVVEGVLANRLYILADPERRTAPEAHWRRMEADFDAAAKG